jgi:hypothetical protein
MITSPSLGSLAELWQRCDSASVERSFRWPAPRDCSRKRLNTRLAAAALFSVFVVSGTVIVALQEPRAKVPKAVER